MANNRAAKSGFAAEAQRKVNIYNNIFSLIYCSDEIGNYTPSNAQVCILNRYTHGITVFYVNNNNNNSLLTMLQLLFSLRVYENAPVWFRIVQPLPSICIRFTDE